jgi:hypothetical protein
MIRNLIGTVNPDETVTVFHSAGSENAFGKVTPKYHPGEAVTAQVQVEKESALAHKTEAIGVTEVTRKFYLAAGPGDMTMGIDRPGGRGGDMIRRADGTWWLVTAVLKDFASSGWVAVRGTLQATPPEGLADG